MRSLVAFAAVAWLISLPSSAVSAGPVPAWQVEEASVRVVFRCVDQDAFALCTLPAEAGGQPVATLKADADGAARPVRVVWTNDSSIHALVDCSGLPANTVVAVYGIVGEHRAMPQAKGAIDPKPIRIAARRSVGQDAPATLDDLKLLALRPGANPDFFAVPGFDGVAAVIGKYAKGGGWQHPLVLLRLTSWVFVPAEARYVFALKGDNAAWLQLNGDAVVGQSYSRGRPTRQESCPVTLSAGMHRLILDVAVRYAYTLEVLWRTADEGAAELALVTGGSVVDGRIERREGDLHVFARTRRGAPYRFLGTPALFSSLTLQDGSVCWSNSTLAYAWQINGVPVGNERSVETVLVTTNNTPDEVKLEVRREDDPSIQGTDTVVLPADTVPAVEFRVSSSLIGAPAVCYGEDPVEPEIEVRATSPDALPFTVRTEVVGRDDTIVVSEYPLAPARSWGRVALPPAEANAFREINWQVLHAGVAIDSGRWVFDASPFDGLPDGVHGVALRRRGAGVTLIARRASQGESNLFMGLTRGQRLLFLDGFLAPEGVADRTAAEALDHALANGPGGLTVAYQRIYLPTLEHEDDPRGVSRLAPLAYLRDLLPVDVVLLAPDLSGARDGETPDLFERRLAAFAGTLTEAGKARLILIAPPAFDVLPGCGCVPGETPCVHAAAGRLSAEIVYRVADAYGLSVADLYTPFALDKSGEPLIAGGVFTPAGLKKAAAVFRRILFR